MLSHENLSPRPLCLYERAGVFLGVGAKEPSYILYMLFYCVFNPSTTTTVSRILATSEAVEENQFAFFPHLQAWLSP